MKKYKIISETPFVSDEEINSLKNFDELLKTRKARADKQKDFRFILKTVLLVSFVFTGMFLINKYLVNEQVENRREEIVKPETPSDKDESTTTTGNFSDEAVEMPDKTEQTESVLPIEESPKAKKEEEKNWEETDKEEAEPISENYDYREAEPIDGLEALYDYFDRELRYPEEAIPDSVNGVVLVSFIISTEGKPRQIEILKSPGPHFDREAIRVIENMPLWRPATINDKPIDTKLNIPLTFQMIKK